MDMAEHGGRGRWSRRSKIMAPLGVGAIGAVVGVAGTIVVAALVTTALVRGAALPAGRVFMLTLVGLVGGLATLAVARSHRVGRAGPGPAIAATALAGIAACIAFTTPGRGRGLGMGANLGNAIWWPLVFLLLWALPLGVLGAAAGSARARRRRARERAGLVSAP